VGNRTADGACKRKAGVEGEAAQLFWGVGLRGLLEGIELGRASGRGWVSGSHFDNVWGSRGDDRKEWSGWRQ
jgi:hypothetical protein